ncbi:aldehyde dehydrogenase [Sphingobium sp. EP60837]|uniref:aldehyde dehydrogenase n=1 Tax=Sphingobium sp. EP60837 TaxID=1855519 RepID=UPI0007DD60F3|nr:aldehyde dehydrogenase [Sphingobium sp. EP60837]ANI80123.1 Betaine-aldehyde dehydrogenase [Sphingobium sp. EP60837]
MSAREILLSHPNSLFIGGKWIAPSTSKTVQVLDSATEEQVLETAEANVDDVDRAVAAARASFDGGAWSGLKPVERAAYLREISAAVRRRQKEFANAWSLESGILYSRAQAVGDIITGVLNRAADLADTFTFEEPHRSITGMKATLVREPVGVVAAIIPWNGPAPLTAYKLGSALLAGCTMVIKMSPEAPAAGYLFAEIFEEIGLPAGVANVIVADREASQALVADNRVDKIAFTGSTAAGRSIASACGQRIARYTLELGGKSPAIILDDFDIETAARTIGGGVSSLTGQVCHSLTRIIVPRRRQEQMVEAVSAYFATLKIGDQFDPASDVGPLSTGKHRETVERYIEIGKAEGARLAYGGGRPNELNRGYYVEPTLFADVDNRSTIGQEEIFGPVLAVIPVENEEEAVQIANDSIFGLNASIFTNDGDRFRHLARRLRSGTVGQNASRTDVSIGFGGFKQSGIGREGGVEGLLAYLESKVVVTDQPIEEVAG